MPSGCAAGFGVDCTVVFIMHELYFLMGSDEFSYIVARQEANDETEQPGGCHNEGFLEGGVACQKDGCTKYVQVKEY